MSVQDIKCALLADRHHGLTEGIRGLLDTVFDTVVMVADENSLVESASRLHPTLAVVDLSLVHGGSLRWLQRLRSRCPDLRILALSVHDEASVRQTAIDAGANGVVLKRSIVTDLLPAIDEALAEAPVSGPKLNERSRSAEDSRLSETREKRLPA